MTVVPNDAKTVMLRCDNTISGRLLKSIAEGINTIIFWLQFGVVWLAMFSSLLIQDGFFPASSNSYWN